MPENVKNHHYYQKKCDQPKCLLLEAAKTFAVKIHNKIIYEYNETSRQYLWNHINHVQMLRTRFYWLLPPTIVLSKQMLLSFIIIIVVILSFKR